MATKKTTTTSSSSSSSRGWSAKKILECLAYFGLIFIAIALLLAQIIPSLAGSFQMIGQFIAYLLVLCLSFNWTMRKRRGRWTQQNMWWLICWIIAAIAVVSLYVTIWVLL